MLRGDIIQEVKTWLQRIVSSCGTNAALAIKIWQTATIIYIFSEEKTCGTQLKNYLSDTENK